ncbi:MAG: hypothetical protein J6M19_03890 [Bacteroidaceae bacterium]|nr:hypothetical protein [Bacteroidaceae bacterium]
MMILKTHILTLLLGLTVVFSVHAHVIDSVAAGRPVVQEKVYLHFDNNCYFGGDTIWYKAYVCRADNHRPTDMSRILYVELLNEQGYLVERQQLVVDYAGQAHGQFALSDSCWAGYYEVRAYTRWMMNFGYERAKKWTDTRRILREDGRTETWGSADFRDMRSGRVSHENAVKEVENQMGQLNMDGLGKEKDEDHSDKRRRVHGLDIYSGDYDNALTIDAEAEGLRYRMYHGLFSRVLPVYQKPKSPELLNSRVMPVKITMGDFKKIYTHKDVDFQFYPEGGYLVYGHSSYLAWEAQDREGRRMNVSGVLLEDGVVIDSICPVHAGRGRVLFCPQRGHSYEVKVRCGGKTFSPPFPEIEDEGCTVSVRQLEDSVVFSIYRTLPDERTLFLALTCRGVLVEMLSVDMRNGRSLVTLPKEKFPTGVNEVTLFDGEERIFSDRLFFVAREGEGCMRAKVTTPNGMLRPYERVGIDIDVATPDGLPAAGQTFSVAVRDASRLDESFCTGNIMTELLLQSELKGFVETPDWYFKTGAWDALDNLMLVQGWRRYDWREAVQPMTGKPDYEPEKSTVIRGRVQNIQQTIFQKERGDIQLFCSLRLPVGVNDSITLIQGTMNVGDEGWFNIEYPPFYGEAQLVMRGKYVKKLSRRGYRHLLHDKNILIRKEYFHPNFARGFDWFETNKPEYATDSALVGRRYDRDSFYGPTLPEVQVKAKRRAHLKRLRNKPVFSIDALDYENWMWDMGYINVLEDKFDNGEISHPLSYYNNLINSTFGMFDSEEGEQAMLCFNWTMVEVNPMLAWKNRFLTFLKRIDVVTDDPLRPSPFQLYHLDRRVNHRPLSPTEVEPGSHAISKFVNIVTYPEDERPIRDGREWHFKGFNRPAEFYSPDYSKRPLPTVPDHRHTLYWNPTVKTDSQGHATVEFYNNASCTEMYISAEGLTQDGRFIVYEKE